MQVASEGKLHCARTVSAMPENRLPSSDIFTPHRLLHRDGAVKTHWCFVLQNKPQSRHPSRCVTQLSVTSPARAQTKNSLKYINIFVRSNFFYSLPCISSLPYFTAPIFSYNLTRREDQQRGRWWMSCFFANMKSCAQQFIWWVRIWKALCCMSH